MIIFFIPHISNAIKCSLVCGCGHFSSAATNNKAASTIALPESMVAIKVSCPGASTKETDLVFFAFPPHSHFSEAPYFLHLSQ